MDCIFCKINKNRKIVAQNDLSLAFHDEFPVSKGHILIIPKRHVANFFDLSSDEKISIFDLISVCKNYIDKEYSPDGYNIGVNVGEAAGQSVFHVHIHLIPRYYGDMENPRGGVRGVLPQFRNY